MRELRESVWEGRVEETIQLLRTTQWYARDVHHFFRLLRACSLPSLGVPYCYVLPGPLPRVANIRFFDVGWLGLPLPYSRFAQLVVSGSRDPRFGLGFRGWCLFKAFRLGFEPFRLVSVVSRRGLVFAV